MHELWKKHLNRYSGIKEMDIFTKFFTCRQVSRFQKGVTYVIIILWVIIKSRFNFKLFNIFCNGCVTFSEAKSADEEAMFVESAVAKSTRCKNKWASRIFEEWQ